MPQSNAIAIIKEVQKMRAEKKLFICKILLFAFAFFIAFMPSTASRNSEVNSRVIVEILGLDGGEKLSITAQYVMPTAAQSTAGKDTVTVEGNSLTEAIEALDIALGRRAELGHCSMVIVGKDVEPDVLGTLMTATDVTADVNVSAAEDSAKNVIGDITDFMSKTGATDADFIVYGAKKSHIATNTLLGFLSDLGSASKSAYLPVVQMLKSQDSSSDSQSESKKGKSGGQSEQDSGQSGQGGEQGGGQSGQKEQSGMIVDRLAVYNENGRAGILESDSARGVAWASARTEKGIVTADAEFDGEVVKNVSGRLIKKRACVKVDADRGVAYVNVKAYIEPNGDKFNRIFATNSTVADAAMRKGFAKKIKSEMEKAYADSIALDCDPLFIGREFYRYAPDYFETRYNYKDIDVKFDIEVVIK